ncbi:MAG: aminodeoxychorismate synthase component I [Phycisphaerae bacterium]|jgi:para-aminobenzoate synthetase/4-amino-4-deoxychorismate lyase
MNTVILQNPAGGWLVGAQPVGVIEARTHWQVLPALAAVDAACRGGRWAVGFVCYEAAAGLDEHLCVHDFSHLPLAWFALFDRLDAIDALPAADAPFEVGPWQPHISSRQFQRDIAAIKELIASGDTYQVNYTLRLRAGFRGSSESFFARLAAAQRASCAAFIDCGQHTICSASPELFFDLQDGTLSARPMKGTARRGLWTAQDDDQARRLNRCPKNRAENAMIVDMIRNDLGRVAQRGSVRVDEAFAIERYPTVLQMTSTVRCRTKAALAEIFAAMFPCASITGAPKVRTMQIIRQLESQPRGLYTGSIGLVYPGGDARFSVAIRTVVVDKHAQSAEYGVGGGIVWDSTAADEYAECRDKAAVLTATVPRFDLLETLRFEPAQGYALLDEHLARLADSARYFGYPVDLAAVRAELERLAGTLLAPTRVRLCVDPAGLVRTETAPAPPARPDVPWRLRLARAPIDCSDVFLYHKTTHRRVYEEAMRGRGDCDDVLLHNHRGEITETTIANIVCDFDGRRLTPPRESGLLGGTLRSRLIERGEIVEGVIRVEDLPRCREMFAINSVRGWMKATLVDN